MKAGEAFIYISTANLASQAGFHEDIPSLISAIACVSLGMVSLSVLLTSTQLNHNEYTDRQTHYGRPSGFPFTDLYKFPHSHSEKITNVLTSLALAGEDRPLRGQLIARLWLYLSNVLQKSKLCSVFAAWMYTFCFQESLLDCLLRLIAQRITTVMEIS